MIGLTQRQREIADFIENYQSTNRISPSYREIGDYFGFSSLGTVYNQIRILKKKGVLQEGGSGARSLELAKPHQAEIDVPLIGKLQGGMAIQTFSRITSLPVPSSMISTDGECYLLRVEGEGLLEELMLEGDLLLIDPRSTFEASEMVIALIEGSTTLVKKAYLEPPYYRFESIHPHVQSLILREDHVEIQGVVVGLIRNFN